MVIEVMYVRYSSSTGPAGMQVLLYEAYLLYYYCHCYWTYHYCCCLGIACSRLTVHTYNTVSYHIAVCNTLHSNIYCTYRM